MILAHPVPTRYRQPLLGAPDPRMRKALAVASGIAFVLLVVVWIAPAPSPTESTVDELPERLARLIVEEPEPIQIPLAPAAPTPKVEVVQPAPTRTPDVSPPKPKNETIPQERRRPRETKPKVAENRGQTGRKQAQKQVTEELAAVSAEVDETLASLSDVLPTSTRSDEVAAAPARRGGRALRAGRGARATGSSSARQTTGSASLDGSELATGTSDLGELGAFDLSSIEGDAGAATQSKGVPGGTGTGDRSASSLMSVLKRYAPGIRYCYDTALEHDSSLRGKMTFRITVARDGRVANVEVLENTLRSADVERCALTQIDAWRFGAAASASVFDAPFVFRPTD